MNMKRQVIYRITDTSTGEVLGESEHIYDGCQLHNKKAFIKLVSDFYDSNFMDGRSSRCLTVDFPCVYEQLELPF